MAINSRDVQNLENAQQKLLKIHQDIAAFPADLTEKSSAEQVVFRTIQQFGGLDILIANAGGPPPGPFEKIDDETWQKAVELSFLSTVRLIRAALPYLRRSTSPAVLTVTSTSIKQPIPNLILSNSVRAATAGLTKSLAIELGSEGIRFNSILPSWTDTDRVTSLLNSRAAANGTTFEQEHDAQAREVPLGRLARPEEFAKAAAFLVSPAASYISGVMLNVDGASTRGLF